MEKTKPTLFKNSESDPEELYLQVMSANMKFDLLVNPKMTLTEVFDSLAHGSQFGDRKDYEVVDYYSLCPLEW